MTETLRQSLSALVDQEATEFEARKTLDSTKTRSDLKAYWASCQAISSTMRGESLLGFSLLDRINADLDGVAEAKPIVDACNHQAGSHVTFLPAKEALPNRFAALTGQLAIAASIAFAVVIGVKVVVPVNTQPSVAVSEPMEVIKFQMPVQKEMVSVDGITSQQDVLERRPLARILTEQDMKQLVSNRLGSYLIRHAENTAVVGGTSVLPLARIMGRDEPIE
jgi:sigma-E factor negative regulatory protein RseA